MGAVASGDLEAVAGARGCGRAHERSAVELGEQTGSGAVATGRQNNSLRPDNRLSPVSTTKHRASADPVVDDQVIHRRAQRHFETAARHTRFDHGREQLEKRAAFFHAVVRAGRVVGLVAVDDPRGDGVERESGRLEPINHLGSELDGAAGDVFARRSLADPLDIGVVPFDRIIGDPVSALAVRSRGGEVTPGEMQRSADPVSLVDEEHAGSGVDGGNRARQSSGSGPDNQNVDARTPVTFIGHALTSLRTDRHRRDIVQTFRLTERCSTSARPL